METVWDRSSDDDLLGAAGADPLAFGAFYRRHEQRMLAYFLGRVGDAEVAADLTAETFAAALDSSHRFRARSEPATAWLFGIARNTLAMSRRRGRVEARARQRLGMPQLVLTDELIERIEALDGTALALVEGLPADQGDAVKARIVDGARLRRDREGPALLGGGGAQAGEPRARRRPRADGGGHVTLIPDLERQLTDAATSRSRKRRRAARAVATGTAVAALVAALFAITLWQADDSGERRTDTRPSGGPLGLDIPAGHRPELPDVIAAFRRERTARDDNGFTKADLNEIPNRQPGEDPTKSRRVDLPSGPVYLWPMTDGVCSSFGGCIGIDGLLDVGGVAVGASFSAARDGRPTRSEINGVVVDGIEEVRLIRPGAEEIVIPVRENVFRLDVSSMQPVPAGAQLHWRDADGKPHAFKHKLFPGLQIGG